MADLTIETVTGGLEVFDKLGDEWRELLKAVNSGSLYWRPEWILAALRAYSPLAKVAVVTVRRRGSLCTIFPLVSERGKFAGLPARKLRAPLTAAGVGIDLLCAVSGPERDEAIALVWKAIKNMKGWDVLELPSVLQDAAIERLPELARNEGHLADGWSLPPIAFFVLAQGPKGKTDIEKYPRHPKLRSKIRQREMRLSALGTLRLLRTEKDGALGLQRFYEMEAGGWKGKENCAIISDPRKRQFFDEVIGEAERLGHLCLYTLELDGKAIAAHIGFTYQGRYWAVKSTYDESYGDYAPGHLIVKAILRDCSERGISEYVMGVREDWKMEWTQDARRRNFQCIFSRGLWARALYAVRFSVLRRLSRLKALRRAGSTLAGLVRRSTVL